MNLITNTERVRNWRKANPEKATAIWVRRAAAKPDSIRKANRKCFAAHREARMATKKLWRHANPQATAEHGARYRAHKKHAPGGGVSPAQWQELLKEYGGRCAYCARSDRVLTQDHIDPLSKGGEHDISNVAPACLSCNASKGDRTLLVWVAQGGLQ